MIDWSPDRKRLAQALGLGPVWRMRGVAGGMAMGDGRVGGNSAGSFADNGDATGGAWSGVDVAVAAVSDELVGGRAAPVRLRAVPTNGDVETLGWDDLEQAVRACTACGLCRARSQTVFGVGRRDAEWLFVGEAPGAEEDAQGIPFVGQAGRLLDHMLAAARLGREKNGAEAVYIANVIKCRPPANRNPEPDEVARCTPFLLRQIELLRPRVVVAMGRFAVQALLHTDSAIGALRGRVHEFASGALRIPVIVTYHPAYLLRTPRDKAKAWEDLCLARHVHSAAMISRDDTVQRL